MCTTFDTENGQRELKQCEKKEIRRNSRSHLQEIRNIIREPETAYLEHIICEKAGILHGKPLSLDEASKFKPIFFNSYKGELYDLTESDDDRDGRHDRHDRHEYNEEGHEGDHARSLSWFLESYFNAHYPKGACGSHGVL